MPANVVPFAIARSLHRNLDDGLTTHGEAADKRAGRDWTQQEIAEFYRVESALVQAGLALQTDRGLSDEGDPWFAFCRADTGDVFIHFARIGSLYLVAGVAFPEPATGPDFTALVRELVSRHPLADANVLPFGRGRRNSNVFLHPAALLIAVVGAAFFHTGQAKAAEPIHTGKALTPPQAAGAGISGASLLAQGDPRSNGDALSLDAGQAAVILTAAMIGLGQSLPQAAANQTVGVCGANGESSGLSSMEAAPTNILLERATLGPHALTAETGPAPDSPSPMTLPAMKSIIALVAVLSDLATRTASIAQSSQIGLTLAPHDAPIAPPSNGPCPAVHPGVSFEQAFILVHFHVAALPDFEAVQAVQLSGALAYVDVQAIGVADRLPAQILELINRGLAGGYLGEQAQGADTLKVDAGFGQGGQPALSDANAKEASSASAASTPNTTASPGSAPTTANASTPPTSAPPPAAAAPVAIVTHLYGVHDPQVGAAVLHFATQAPQLDVVITGRDILLYDGHALVTLPVGALDSVTFNFDDGSAISLIGTVQELAASHLLH